MNSDVRSNFKKNLLKFVFTDFVKNAQDPQKFAKIC